MPVHTWHAPPPCSGALAHTTESGTWAMGPQMQCCNPPTSSWNLPGRCHPLQNGGRQSSNQKATPVGCWKTPCMAMVPLGHRPLTRAWPPLQSSRTTGHAAKPLGNPQSGSMVTVFEHTATATEVPALGCSVGSKNCLVPAGCAPEQASGLLCSGTGPRQPPACQLVPEQASSLQAASIRPACSALQCTGTATGSC